jgi:tRNA-dihydrouridine synthase
MSKVPARWERVKRAVEIRNELKSETLIFGNGDVSTVESAKSKVEETGCDGVMLGRAIFGNPFLFEKVQSPKSKVTSERKRLEVLIEHAKLFEEKLGGIKNFYIMKKHFKSYLKGIPDSKELCMALMNTENAEEVEDLIEKFLISNS